MSPSMQPEPQKPFLSQPWARVAVFVVGYFVTALVVFLPVTMVLLAAGVVSLDELEAMADGDLGQGGIFLFAIALATAIFGVAYAVIYIFVVEKKRPRHYGLVLSRGWFGNFWLWTLAGVAILGIVFVLELLFGLVTVSSVNLDASVAMSLVYYFPLFVLVAISEEFVFRGYVLQTPFDPPLVPVIWTWLFMSSIIFSLFHAINPGYSMIGFLNTAVVGIGLCFLLIITRSLWAPIGFHFGWNLSLAWLYSLNVSGLDMEGVLDTETSTQHAILNGGDYGPEGGLICTAVILVLIAAMFPRAMARIRSQENVLPWLLQRTGNSTSTSLSSDDLT